MGLSGVSLQYLIHWTGPLLLRVPVSFKKPHHDPHKGYAQMTADTFNLIRSYINHNDCRCNKCSGGMSENQTHKILYIKKCIWQQIAAKSAMCRICKSSPVACNRESSTCIHLFEHLYLQPVGQITQICRNRRTCSKAGMARNCL